MQWGIEWLAVLTFICRGVEPLTGDDIAEVVVFAAGRRENVVIADTLVYPSHQVSSVPTACMNVLKLMKLGGCWGHAPQVINPSPFHERKYIKFVSYSDTMHDEMIEINRLVRNRTR